MKKIILSLASLGLIAGAGAAFQLAKPNNIETKAVANETSRKVYIWAHADIKAGATLAVWANSTWTTLDSTETISGVQYYTFSLPTSITSMNIVRAAGAKSGTTWSGDAVAIYNQTENIAVKGFNLFSLTGSYYGGSSYMEYSSTILENLVDGATKRIFLDRGGHYTKDGEVYAFYTQGYFFKPTGYEHVADYTYYAYYDVPLSLLLAEDKTYYFCMYSNTFGTYGDATNESALAWDSGKVFYHNSDSYKTVTRETGYGTVTDDYKQYLYNSILKEINPCDTTSPNKNYLGAGALGDLETVWHLNSTDSHGLGLGSIALDGSTSYNSNANGETVLTKLQMMASVNAQAHGSLALSAEPKDNYLSIVVVSSAVVALGAAGILFAMRRQRDE